ncbi:hypothetical protein WY02_10185 [Pseudonocardia sp. AL041005-10]|nr:hypothetical protein [Pseudonocardia sp. AL041005-10]ALE78740.1 hypothetical protein WY02_10185 [Pseudonocardia sp. AL041005-10]
MTDRLDPTRTVVLVMDHQRSIVDAVAAVPAHSVFGRAGGRATRRVDAPRAPGRRLRPVLLSAVLPTQALVTTTERLPELLGAT